MLEVSPRPSVDLTQPVSTFSQKLFEYLRRCLAIRKGSTYLVQNLQESASDMLLN
jgi:hypothetical protein